MRFAGIDFSMEKKESSLLTPDDEKIKIRIANKPRSPLNIKRHKKRLNRLLLNHLCSHDSIIFSSEDYTIRCRKCNEKLFQLNGEIEFRLFCELSGTDPEKFIL